MPVCVPRCLTAASKPQILLTLLAEYVISLCETDVNTRFRIGQIHKETSWGYMFRLGLELSSPRKNNKEAMQKNIKPIRTERENRILEEMSHCWAPEMCTVHRNRTISRR